MVQPVVTTGWDDRYVPTEAPTTLSTAVVGKKVWKSKRNKSKLSQFQTRRRRARRRKRRELAAKAAEKEAIRAAAAKKKIEETTSISMPPIKILNAHSVKPIPETHCGLPRKDTDNSY